MTGTRGAPFRACQMSLAAARRPERLAVGNEAHGCQVTDQDATDGRRGSAVEAVAGPHGRERCWPGARVDAARRQHSRSSSGFAHDQGLQLRTRRRGGATPVQRTGIASEARTPDDTSTATGAALSAGDLDAGMDDAVCPGHDRHPDPGHLPVCREFIWPPYPASTPPYALPAPHDFRRSRSSVARRLVAGGITAQDWRPRRV